MKTEALIKELLKRIDKDFGKWKCKPFLPADCPACRGEKIRRLLRWYLSLCE